MPAPAKPPPGPTLLDLTALPVLAFPALTDKAPFLTYKPATWPRLNASSAPQGLRPQYLSPTLQAMGAGRSAADQARLDAARRSIDAHMTDQMTAMMYGMSKGAMPSIRNDRRSLPDTSAGLEEAMRLDAPHSVDFGLVIRDQVRHDPDMIRRWIWGPQGEFTGYPAGDDGFDRTGRRVVARGRPTTCPLIDYEDRLNIRFEFTPREHYYALRGRQPYAEDWGLFMVQFSTYADQAEWAALARRQAEDLMHNGRRGQDGGF